MGLSLRKLEHHLGAEVSGVNLTTPLDGTAIEALRQALLAHGVLVFRDQFIDDVAQVAFSLNFGRVEVVPKKTGGAVPPEILELADIGDPAAYASTAQYWHTDGSFRPVPAFLTTLRAIEISAEGGDTCFASTCAGYEALSPARREALVKLSVVHDIARSRGLIPNLAPFTAEEKAAYPPTVHPLIRAIPETGRKLLYVGAHAREIVGMPAEESRVLLDELLTFTTQPQFTYRHRWRPGDYLVWDNRGLLHCATPYDASRYRRVMHRTEVAGHTA